MKSKNKSHNRTKTSAGKGAGKKGKGRTGSTLRMRLVPLFLAVILVAAAWSYYPVARTHYQAQREKESLQLQLAAAQQRNAELREGVERLKTPAGVEEVARESLGFVKEGENLYVVVDATSSPAPAPPETAEQAMYRPPDAGLLQRVLDVVFGFEG